MSRGLHKWVLAFTLQAGISSLAFAGPRLEYPSPALFWSARQYTDFYFVHFNTRLALPHLRKPESRALFERLIDRGNIERIAAASTTRHQKQSELRLILATMGSLRGSYNLAVIIGEPLEEELTQVQVFHLYLIGVVAQLEQEGLAHAGGSPAMKTALLGVVQSLSEQEIYSPAQIATLGDAAARRYPVLSELFSERERLQLHDRISALQEKQTEPRSRLALGRLLATIGGT